MSHLNVQPQARGVSASARFVVLAGLSALPAASALAQTCNLPAGNFSLAVTVNNVCKSTSSSTAQGLFDKLDTAGFQSLGLAYTDTTPATAAAGFNGIKFQFTFPNAGSTVNFSIPVLNYNKTFSSAATRDGNLDLLVEDLKKSDIISQIVNYQARNAPNSQITGSGGLIPNVVGSDFNQNFTASASTIAAPAPAQAPGTPAGQTTPNLVGLALTFGSFSSTNPDGSRNDVRVSTLPLSYTFRNNLDPRRQLVISIPLTQVDVNGAKSYSGGTGLAYRFPVNDRWTVVPSVRASLVGSLDLATVAGVYTAGLTSVYVWDLGRFSVAMGNMLSYNATMKFKGGDFSYDPNVQTTAFRNGVMLSQPVSMGGQRMSVEYSLVDTRYIAGLRPFQKDYQEVGITVGTNKNALSARSFLRAGLTYTHAKSSKGVTANIGYWF